MSDVMGAGALGIEIIISGKIPSSRAKRWRFYQGYLKKCGDIALTGVDTAYSIARLKSGIVGIQVRIMPPETKLPDDIKLIEEKEEVIEEIKEPEKETDKKIEEVKKKFAEKSEISGTTKNSEEKEDTTKKKKSKSTKKVVKKEVKEK